MSEITARNAGWNEAETKGSIYEDDDDEEDDSQSGYARIFGMGLGLTTIPVQDSF